MRSNPSFYVHEFNPDRLLEIKEAYDENEYAKEVITDFSVGNVGSTYVCLLIDKKNLITHLCRMRRAKSAGVRRRSVYFEEIQEILTAEKNIIQEAVLSSLRGKRKSAHLLGEMKLTKGENENVIKIVREADAKLAELLCALGRADASLLKKYSSQEKTILVLERDALGMAMEIAFTDREQLRLDVTPKKKEDSFLALIDEVRRIEDEYIAYDKDRFPDMQKLEIENVRRSTFTDKGNELHVIHANRNKLETATGVDLIYYHKNFRLLLCVQYKMLEKNKGGFKLVVDKKFHAQRKKMHDIQNEIPAIMPKLESDYRLNSGAYFYKFVSRLECNLRDNALCPGLYIPLSLVTQLVTADPPSRIGMDDVRSTRHLTNSDFSRLVREGWIGCHDAQIKQFEKLIKAALDEGKSIVAAISNNRR